VSGDHAPGGGYALGIDLGTTYTAAAVARHGRAEVAALGYRATSVPTVVVLTEDGRVLVGDAAERRASASPDRVAREFKRRIGDPTPLLLGGTPVAVDRCAAEVLRWAHDTVASSEGGPPAALTVTHPANWGEYKRDVLREALRLADLPGGSLLAEPVAAATWYARAERMAVGSTIAVYDLGGGTFDAAVLRRLPDGTFATLGRPEGIERLGGIDVDQAIFGQVLRVCGYDPSDLPDSQEAALARLRRECVEAKVTLSSETSATIPVWLGGDQRTVLVRRTELEELIAPMLLPTVDALRRVVSSAGLSADDLDAVLLVGGSSRVPLIGRQVSAGLGRPVAVDAHPKHPVALGAALHAAAGLEVAPPPVPVVAAVAAAPPPSFPPPNVGPQPQPRGPEPGLGPRPGGRLHVPPELIAAPPPPPRPVGGEELSGRARVLLGAVSVLAVAAVMAVVIFVSRHADDGGADGGDGSEATDQAGGSGEGTAPAGAPEARSAWTATLPEETTGDVAAVDDDRAYVVDDRGTVTAFDLASGDADWAVDVGEESLSGTPARAGDVLLVTVDMPGSVVALDPATGAQRWRIDDRRDPYVVAGDVFVAHSGTTVSAHEVATGTTRWEVETELQGWPTPTLVGQTVVIGGRDGRIAGLDLAAGAVRWVHPLPRGDVVVEELAAAGDAVVAVDEDGWVTAVDAATGTERWAVDVAAGGFDPPIAVGDAVAVPTEDGLAMLEPASGAVRSTVSGASSSIALAAGEVPAVVADTGGGLQAFDTEGRSLWTAPTSIDGIELVGGTRAVVLTDYEGGVEVFTYGRPG
jgi:molecular chaperone DnaK